MNDTDSEIQIPMALPIPFQLPIDVIESYPVDHPVFGRVYLSVLEYLERTNQVLTRNETTKERIMFNMDVFEKYFVNGSNDDRAKMLQMR